MIDSTENSTVATARAFFSKLIDFAGLFPPAQQPIDAALRDYLSLKESPYNWMLSRFILPLNQVEELISLIPRNSPKLPLTVIGTTHNNPLPFVDTVQHDLQQISTLNRSHAGAIQIEVYETPLVNPRAYPEEWGVHIATYAASINLQALSLFFEIPAQLPLNSSLAPTIHALNHLKNSGVENRPTMGIKVRCGGLTPDAFPSVERLAAILSSCGKHKIAMKCTAGLHHPLRHTDEELGVDVHGFVNLFGASMLAAAGSLSEEQVASILEIREKDYFSFATEQFCCGELVLTTEQIQQLRRAHCISFGSCSFAEPLEDLITLNWIG